MVFRYPTLLRTPKLGDTANLNIMATWPEANPLPLEPHAYQVVRAPGGWSVRVAATGEVIYRGAGRGISGVSRSVLTACCRTSTLSL